MSSNQSASPSSKARASTSFIFATIFLDSLGIGIIMPILPDLIRRFSADPGFVARYLGYFMSAYALMQFLFSPILGRLADRFGRRPVLLFSLFGAGIDYVVMAFAPTLLILFIGRLISGATGASYTVATAYMADVSDDSNRSANFGLIGAAFGFGFIIGPAIGGIIGHQGITYPFLAAAFLNLLNFLFGLFVLPESLKVEQRRPIKLTQLNPFRSLKKIFFTSGIGLIVCVFGLLYLASNVHPSVWTLYAEAKFGWNAQQVGWSLAFVGAMIALVQGWLMRIVIPLWGDLKALFIGVTVGSIGFISLAFITQGWMAYVILVPNALSGIAGPALQSLVSKEIPANEQGELQGSLMSLAALTAVIAPLMYTAIFTRSFLGLPYLVAGLICGSSLLFIALKRARLNRT